MKRTTLVISKVTQIKPHHFGDRATDTRTDFQLRVIKKE